LSLLHHVFLIITEYDVWASDSVSVWLYHKV
jgi:hypothetical protein